MKTYLEAKEELKILMNNEAGFIANELVRNNCGKTVKDLRKDTLEYIKENDIPYDIACLIKEKIDSFIYDLKIIF